MLKGRIIAVKAHAKKESPSMGWVKDRIRDEADYPRLIPQLWNLMRDSVGQAVSESNETTSDASEEHLTAADCKAMGDYCRRIEKAFGAVSVEVFLEPKTRTLRTTHGVVCRYRISADRSAAEFFVERADGSPTIAVDEACRLALEDFVTTPASQNKAKRS